MEKNYTEALLEPVKMEKRGFGSLGTEFYNQRRIALIFLN